MKSEAKGAPTPASILGGKKEPKKSAKKAKHKRTMIDHLDDGSHVVTLTPHQGDEVKFSRPDLDGLHDALEEHLGDPNHDEEAAKEGA